MADGIKIIKQPGGSALAPTGVVAFENDWPGAFIRGDELGEIHAEIEFLKSQGVKTIPPLIRKLAELSEKSQVDQTWLK